MTTFGRWDELLAQPQPAANLDYSNAIWHYVRATAFAAKDDIENAKSELAAMQSLRETDQILYLDGVMYPASQLLLIADALARGDIAMAEGATESAITYYSEAVDSQDALPYTEPPFWYYPNRQSLGKALMVAGKPAEAEAVYRRDLEIYRHNGWSIFGLVQALEAQGKAEEAAEMRGMFEHAWAQSDVVLTSSRL
jgi:tetratricopeptide (TPR) repeat protein